MGEPLLVEVPADAPLIVSVECCAPTGATATYTLTVKVPREGATQITCPRCYRRLHITRTVDEPVPW